MSRTPTKQHAPAWLAQGERKAKRRTSRRRVGRDVVSGLAAVLVAALITATATVYLATDDAGSVAAGAPASDPAGASRDEQDTLLLVRASPGEPAEGVTLLAGGGGNGRPTVLFIPTGTLVEIPGFGLERLGQAMRYGGADLLEASAENALRVSIDHTAVMSDSDLSALLARAGGMDLVVPARLVERREDGSGTVAFEAGEQYLNGTQLARYWAFQTDDEDELSTFARREQVIEGLLAMIAAERGVARQLAGDQAAELETTAEPAWLRGLLIRLAQAQEDGDLSYTLLPVEPFGGSASDGGATYRLRDEELAELLDARLAGSVPSDGVAQGVRVQVLNGVGTPGIGQAVDARLEGSSLRIVQTDNASSFDFAETRIVIYDETAASRQAAQRVRELLGVGSIQVSRQPQSVIDLTIVVGADFAAEMTEAVEATEEQT